MIKTKMRNMPVLAMHIDQGDKDALTTEAAKRGLRLTTYCRMLLMDSLRERSEEHK
jgi:hypothetical protein